MATTSAPPIFKDLVITDLQRMPYPRSVLMCRPDYFDVVDVKNPFMINQEGKVDKRLALRQWDRIRQAFESAGVTVQTLPAVAGCEDMAFCANPIFAGLDEENRRVCVLGHMRYASRQAEVPAYAAWFGANGYRVVALSKPCLFEGSGDALWHPGRRLIWGGVGPRTSEEAYDQIVEVFGAPVIVLKLTMDRFYHLDTCFCPLSETTALVYPPALQPESLELIHQLFPCIIEVSDYEASEVLACNAAPFFGKYVFVQRGAPDLSGRLRDHGFEVIEVNTSEFIKSGGSVFCLKMYLF